MDIFGAVQVGNALFERTDKVLTQDRTNRTARRPCLAMAFLTRPRHLPGRLVSNEMQEKSTTYSLDKIESNATDFRPNSIALEVTHKQQHIGFESVQLPMPL